MATQQQKQEQKTNQKRLFTFWTFLAVVVIAIVILLVSAIIGLDRLPKGFLWSVLALLGIGILLCAGFGLSVLYQKLSEDDDDDGDDEADEEDKRKKTQERNAAEANGEQNKTTQKTAETKSTKTTKSNKDDYKYLSMSRDRVKVFQSMSESVKTISDYYKISKKQANSAFLLSIVFCIAGLMLLMLPIILGAMNLYTDMVAMTGIIAGVVSELFGGTALLVHRSTVSQFNRFYEALHDNEMLLAAICLAERVNETKRDEALQKIIDSTLTCMTDTSAKAAREKEEAKAKEAAKAAEKSAETEAAAED